MEKRGLYPLKSGNMFAWVYVMNPEEHLGSVAGGFKTTPTSEDEAEANQFVESLLPKKRILLSDQELDQRMSPDQIRDMLSRDMKSQSVIAQIAQADFPLVAYPFVLEALHWKTRAVVWSETIQAPLDGSKAVIKIPALRKELGYPVAMRLTFANGQVIEREPEMVQ